MANPQIRIIELPQEYDLSTTFGVDFLAIESAAEGGRKITVYDFFNTGGSALFYKKVAGGGTERAIVTFNSAASALYDNSGATIDSSGTITALGFKATSSQRYKTNIENITGATDLINQLRGVTFDWTLEPLATVAPHDIGLIAEEVANVLPYIVGKDSSGQANSVDYSKLVAVLINAVKELDTRVKALERK
jgi:hypothetical protein